jgi:hypothetical protein
MALQVTDCNAVDGFPCSDRDRAVQPLWHCSALQCSHAEWSDARLPYPQPLTEYCGFPLWNTSRARAHASTSISRAHRASRCDCDEIDSRRLTNGSTHGSTNGSTHGSTISTWEYSRQY